MSACRVPVSYFLFLVSPLPAYGCFQCILRVRLGYFFFSPELPMNVPHILKHRND